MNEAIEWLKLYMDNNRTGNRVTDKYLEVVNALIESCITVQQENVKLKQMVNSPSITFTTCPECGKNYSINYCREVYKLQQQLKDKDEKISKATKYLEKNFYYCLASGDNINHYIDELIDYLNDIKDIKIVN